jgi:hypothetical protein
VNRAAYRRTNTLYIRVRTSCWTRTVNRQVRQIRIESRGISNGVARAETGLKRVLVLGSIKLPDVIPAGGLLCAFSRSYEVRYGNRREQTYDRDNDHDLYECETTFSHLFTSLLLMRLFVLKPHW